MAERRRRARGLAARALPDRSLLPSTLSVLCPSVRLFVAFASVRLPRPRALVVSCIRGRARSSTPSDQFQSAVSWESTSRVPGPRVTQRAGLARAPGSPTAAPEVRMLPSEPWDPTLTPAVPRGVGTAPEPSCFPVPAGSGALARPSAFCLPRARTSSLRFNLAPTPAHKVRATRSPLTSACTRSFRYTRRGRKQPGQPPKASVAGTATPG